MGATLFDQLLALPSAYTENTPPPNAVSYLMGCRDLKQFACTLRALVDPLQFCPFCGTELRRRSRTPAAETSEWLLLANEFPNKKTKQMWLIVPRRHLTNPLGIGGNDWNEIGYLFRRCLEEGNLEGGGVVFRFGNPHLNVGTVPHLHMNIIEPNAGTEYRAPLAKNMSELASDYQRMLSFRDEIAGRGGDAWLFSHEGITETQP